MLQSARSQADCYPLMFSQMPCRPIRCGSALPNMAPFLIWPDAMPTYLMRTWDTSSIRSARSAGRSAGADHVAQLRNGTSSRVARGGVGWWVPVGSSGPLATGMRLKRWVSPRSRQIDWEILRPSLRRGDWDYVGCPESLSLSATCGLAAYFPR